jgi:large subunit ribosomal protein L5
MPKKVDKARLEEHYLSKIRPTLQKKLELDNVMQIPRISKIVLNVGVKDAVSDSKILQNVITILGAIAGQRPVRTVARKSIASFKLREGMPIGAMVTLRRAAMYEFLDRLINLALPKVRDFQGVSNRFDGRGNFNLGVKESTIFPEIDFGMGEKAYGLNISIQTTAKTDAHAYELLKEFGMPFRKS